MAQTEPQGSVRLAAGIAGRLRQSSSETSCTHPTGTPSEDAHGSI